ncbi:MAG: NfeD family protein [Sphaerochaetaceae bacterium]
MLYWFIAGIVFCVIEIFTPTFFLGSVGIGCFFAALASWLALGLAFQLVFFAVGLTLSIVFLRPLLTRKAQERKTNVDSLIGEQAYVEEQVNAFQGRILLKGESWKARSLDGKPIEVGKTIKVISIEGVTAIVKEC